MNASFIRTIKSKVVVSLIVVVTLFILLAEAYQYKSSKAEALRNLNTHSDRVITRLSESLELPLWEVDGQWVKRFLITEMDDAVIFAATVSGDGNVQLELIRNEHWQVIEGGGNNEIREEDYIVRELNVLHHEEKIGTIKLYITRKFMEEALVNELLNNILSALILIILIIISLTIMMDKVVIHPIMQLLDSVKAMSEGGYEFKETESKNDEIGLLGDEFNNMCQNVILREQDVLQSKEQIKSLLEKTEEREQDLSITLNSIGDAVITTDAAGIVTRMNPVAEELTGWSSDEAAGEVLNTIFPIINASTRKPIANPVDKVLKKGETVFLSNHTTLLSKNGKEYQIADSAAPIRNGDDNILGMVLVFNDVTEQYRLREQADLAQRALENKEKEQREILNFMVNGVISIDEDGMVLSFNKAAERLFGYTSSDIIGGNINNLMLEPFASKHNEYLKNYIQTGEAKVIGLGRDVEGLRKDKTVFSMRLLAAELPKGENGKRRFIGSCLDLTYIKQQEEQLRRSQKMDALGKLTGGIAHDYNNILAIILGYTEQIHSHLKNSTRVEKYADNIKHAAERGSKLTKKLLTFSRSKQPNLGVVDINNILLEQQHMLNQALTARITLSLDLEEDIWFVELDSSDLEDAIINMSINALHAMESGGHLTISTRNQKLQSMDVQHLSIKAGDYVLLTITDTGCGMDATTKDKLFDPFYSTKGELGTGLGLSQVYGFVERSAGMIKVYTEVNQGTSFTLYFPKSKISANTEETSDIGITLDLGGTETLLVVDDEQSMVDLEYEIFTALGYRVLTANDGIQALAVLEKEKVDLIISDVIMPRMDGYQLAEKVRKLYPQILIQMMSGFTDERHIGVVDESLHQNVLHKPFTSKVLLTRVRKLLDDALAAQMNSRCTILIMDDDEDIQELFKLKLKKLNCNVVTAYDGEEAITLYEKALGTSEPIDISILDLTIPGGLGGSSATEKIRKLHPEAKIIVTSGNSEAPEMLSPQEYGFDGAIEKGVEFAQLSLILKKILRESIKE